ncbi:MAG: hypothetical protein LBK52_00335, partial [Deltaproteobacteria bacterium]|nr:hypothetical protein [Deltaproteobacteria bacterium]
MAKKLFLILLVLSLGLAGIFAFKTLSLGKDSLSSAAEPDYLAQTAGDNLADSNAAGDTSGSTLEAVTDSKTLPPFDSSIEDRRQRRLNLTCAFFGYGPKQLNIAMNSSLWQEFSDPNDGLAIAFLKSRYNNGQYTIYACQKNSDDW